MQHLPYLVFSDETENRKSVLLYISEDFPDWSDSLAQMLMLTSVVHVIFY